MQKHNEEKLILIVRHNLGLLYATQNLSKLAIRHLSEVTEKNIAHFKAVFLQAREHYKLRKKYCKRTYCKRTYCKRTY